MFLASAFLFHCCLGCSKDNYMQNALAESERENQANISRTFGKAVGAAQREKNEKHVDGEVEEKML